MGKLIKRPGTRGKPLRKWSYPQNIGFDWDGEYQNYEHECNQFLICLSRFELEIILSSIRFAFWPARWNDSDINWNNRHLPKWQLIIGLMERLDMKLLGASCIDDLVEVQERQAVALEGIQQLLNNLLGTNMITNSNTVNVNCGCGCNGQTSQPPSNDSPYTPPPNNAPPWSGTDLPDQKYRCEAAHFIFDSIYNTLQKIQSIVSLIEKFSLIRFLTDLLNAAIEYLSTGNINAIAHKVNEVFDIAYRPGNIFGEIANYMNQEKEAIICSLYNSENTTEAIASTMESLEGIAETAILASTLSPYLAKLAPIFSVIFGEIANTDLINNLFVVSIDISYPDVDCSDCGETEPPGTYTPCYTFNANPQNSTGIASFIEQNTNGLDVWEITPALSDTLYRVITQAYNQYGVEIDVFITNVDVSGTIKPDFYYKPEYPPACISEIAASHVTDGWKLIVYVDPTQMGTDCEGCNPEPPDHKIWLSYTNAVKDAVSRFEYTGLLSDNGGQYWDDPDWKNLDWFQVLGDDYSFPEITDTINVTMQLSFDKYAEAKHHFRYKFYRKWGESGSEVLFDEEASETVLGWEERSFTFNCTLKPDSHYFLQLEIVKRADSPLLPHGRLKDIKLIRLS